MRKNKKTKQERGPKLGLQRECVVERRPSPVSSPRPYIGIVGVSGQYHHHAGGAPEPKGKSAAAQERPRSGLAPRVAGAADRPLTRQASYVRRRETRAGESGSISVSSSSRSLSSTIHFLSLVALPLSPSHSTSLLHSAPQQLLLSSSSLFFLFFFFTEEVIPSPSASLLPLPTSRLDETASWTAGSRPARAFAVPGFCFSLRACHSTTTSPPPRLRKS